MNIVHRLTILCLAFFISYGSLSQRCKVYGLHTEDFESKPWYGNNQYLLDFLADKGFYDSPSLRSHCTTPRYQLPVRIVIFRNAANDPNSAILISEAEDYLGIANRIFEDANTDIRFYMADFEYVVDNQARTQISGLLDFNDDPNFLSSIELFLNYKQEGVINLYFVQNTIGEDINVPGTAATPISSVIPAQFSHSLWSCWVRTNGNPSGGRRDGEAIGQTLAHELGHVLGNAHTHHPGNMYSMAVNGFNGDNAEVGPCHQEVVSRTQRVKDGGGNCLYNGEKLKSEVNGDALSDTPADPNVSEERQAGVVLKGVSPAPNCIYTENGWGNEFEFDRNGTPWGPTAPTRNIMSYSNDDCTTEFSDMQIGLMWDRIEKRFMEYFVGEYTGQNNPFCTAGRTVTLMNPPPSMGLSWTAEPTNLIHSSTRSGLGSSAFIKAAGSARGWATVTFQQADDCNFFNTPVIVWIGTPPDIAQIEGSNYMTTGQQKLYELELPVGQYTSHSWVIPAGMTLVSQAIQHEVVNGELHHIAQVRVKANSAGTRTLKGRTYNACGYTENYVSIEISSSGGSGGGGGGSDPCANTLTISPNPTYGDFEALVLPPGGGDPCMESALIDSDSVGVDPDSFSMTTIEKDGIIIITNHIGEVVYEKKHRGKKINIRLHKLEPGLYVLNYMYNGEELLSTKFIKQ